MNREDLQAFVEALPVPALVMVQERIVAANSRLARLSGVPVAEFLAAPMPFLRFVAPEDRPMVLERAAARARGEPVTEGIDYTGIGADGVPIPSRAHVAPFPAAGETAILMVISDERLRARTATLIRGFVDIAVIAQRERTVSGVFRVVRERLVELGVTSTALELNAGHFRFAPFVPPMGELGVELRDRLGGWAPLSRSRIDLTNASGALENDLEGFAGQLVGMPREHFVGRIAPRGAFATIRIAGEPRYVLICLGPHLDTAASNAFGLLARQLGAVLEGALHIEELDRRNLELSVLFELGREVTEALDLSRVLQKAVDTTARLLRCACAYVLLPEQKDTVLRVAASHDTECAVAIGETLAVDEASLTTLAFKTRQVQISPDVTHDPRISTEVAKRFRSHSALTMPLISKNRPLGVLTVFERGGRVFDEHDLRFATVSAQIISSALENARLYAEARAQADEMALLNDVARRLAGSLEVQPLLQLGGETLQRTVGADMWFMMLPDEAAGGLRFAALPREFEDLAPMVLPFDGQTAAAVAYRQRRMVQLVVSQFVAPQSRQLGQRLGHRATLAVPLIARDQVLGVAVVLDKKQSRSFTPEQMERAFAVAGQLSLALLSARLYQDLRDSYAQLERTQKELIDRERLAALGELSASIAHEVRNPLGVIFNSVGSLRRLLKPQGDVAMLLDIVGEEADRLNRMVGDLLDYSRPVRPALEPVPLRPILEEALSSARQQVGQVADGVKERLRVAQSAATLRADPRLLRQALINLFVNALQAMPRGGHLEVRASSADREAEIVINDTGPGIPHELRARIFQPFFTTKATGTGLGLAVVKRIVEGHGGAIEVGNVSTGAEFRLRLPLDGGTR